MSAPERRDPQDAVFAPEELLRALPTPCYVYDEAQLRTRAARLRSAFSWSAGFRAWFPVRALPNPTVLRILREEGQGALCVTAGEYRLALASGFSPGSIRFAPEFPTDAELAVPAADLVLDDGGLLLRLERERPLPARLGLRLRPEPDRSFHKAEATRFGMRTGELLDTAQELRLKGVREVGLSAMLGLGLRDPEAFSALARALFTCAAALHDSFGLQVSYCCLGGGLPVAHRRTERDADIMAVSRGVQAEFSRIMEPSGLGGVPVETGLGRWLTAHAGILLTTVTGVKRGAQDWLGVDASRADLLRPELYGTYHHISVLGDDRVEGRRRYAVGDRIPEPREPFGQRLLPECRRGARLVIHDVGAYGASMGYSYGLTPHCAEYLYQTDGTLRCIRRAQRENELFSTLDENPDFTAPAETPSGQAESQCPSEG